MNNILLVRHGQSESNAGVLTEHPKTVALTDLGRKQADCIRAAIEQPPDSIVYSGYARSLQTALPLMDKFPDARREEWPIQEFTYLCPMKYYKTTKVERRVHSEVYWKEGLPQTRDGEAESFFDFLRRMKEVFRRLCQTKERMILFTHGHVIRTLFWFFISGLPDLTEQTFYRYRSLRHGIYIPNGAFLAMNLGAKRSLSPLSIDHLPPELVTNREKFPPLGGGPLNWG